MAVWRFTWRDQFKPLNSRAMTISQHHRRLPLLWVSVARPSRFEASSFKLLGLTFDCNMSYGQHLRWLPSKIKPPLSCAIPATCSNLQRFRLAYAGLQPSIIDWCGPSHFSCLVGVYRHKLALKLVGPGGLSNRDSLTLRRPGASGLHICLIHKLLRGPRLLS